MRRTLAAGSIRSIYVEINAAADVTNIRDYLAGFGFTERPPFRPEAPTNNHLFSRQ